MPNDILNVKEIFAEAIRLQSLADRKAYLDDVCSSNAVIRAEVESLLAAHNAADGFLSRAASQLQPAIALRTGGERIGTQIGPYKLIEQIGQGGMGTVYMAEQKQPVRRAVALKVIKRGMDSEQVVARFEVERQALALMNHPHIARVLDAGVTDDGRPYFVMDLVRGIPITDYCDQHRLDHRQRLKLFIKVCQAVQHAHQKGIIHRDLKPSNVLVELHDVSHVPKVIDFGVAKATGQRLTERTLVTHFLQMIGTPLYMSPEQAEFSGLDVDTRSDIYSLGVLLYELLTGSTPFGEEVIKEASLDEIRRIIREEGPQRPSYRISTLDAQNASTVSEHRSTDIRKLRRETERELDWIVMKALEKDRSRRYDTASAMADDVWRYLNGERVHACSPSVGYRFRKYTAKHKALLTSATLVLITAIAGTGISLTYAHKAKRAASAAQVAQGDAERRTLEAQEANERSRSLLYVADMKLASDAIVNADAPRAAELLQRHLPTQNQIDRRSFEWHFFQKRVMPPHSVTLQQNGSVKDVAFSADARWLAVTADRGAIQIYETGTWEKRSLVQTLSESVNGLAWSPDGKSVAAACENGQVFVLRFPFDDQSVSIAGHTGGANDVVFSPNGQVLYSCGADNLTKSWNVHSGEQLQSFAGHQRAVERIALSPDGKLLATASSDQSFAVWDTVTGVPRLHFQAGKGRIVCVVFSPDSRLVAAGTIHGYVQLADIQNATQSVLAKQFDGVESLTFFDGDRWLATADRGGTIQLHAVTDSNKQTENSLVSPPLPWVAHKGRALSLEVVPGGTSLISGGRDGAVRVWTPDLWAANWSSVSHCKPSDVAFGPHGQLYISGRSIYVWDIRKRQLVDWFASEDLRWKKIACSADGTYMAACCNGRLTLFHVPLREVVAEWSLDPRLDPHRIAITSDGSRIAFSDFTDREFVMVFNRDGLPEPRRFPAKQCECLTFSPDGRWLVAGHMNDLRLFDLQNRTDMRELKCHSDTLASAAFSPDGSLLATVGHDRLLKVWRFATGEELFSVVAHREVVRGVTFSPDGRTICTVGDDRQIKLWQTATGQPLGALANTAYRMGKILFDADGLSLAVASAFTPRSIVLYDSRPSDLTPGRQYAKSDDMVLSIFFTLGDLPGGRHVSVAYDMSADGLVVVGTSDSSKGRQGYRWTAEGGMQALESPDEVWALRTSADGSAVIAASNHNGRNRPAIWKAPAYGLEFLPLDAKQDDQFVFSSLERSGRILAGEYRKSGTTLWRAATATRDTHQLLPGPEDAEHCSANVITQGGRMVVGTAWNGDVNRGSSDVYGARVIRWREGRLEMLPGFEDSKYNWVAWDASDDGRVIVGARWPVGTEGPWLGGDHVRPFIWERGEATVLHNVDGLMERVSSDGQIALGGGDIGAFIWDQKHGLRRIENLLTEQGNDLKGWWLKCCWAISADRTVIVGNAVAPDGREEAWLARIPAFATTKATNAEIEAAEQ
jgi:WD40 repeat protein/serine/threonine protein kinase